ncbi:MAG: 4a-hydroxytetrahydrobiopterin dehydratase [Nitrososphaerales archaeon]
MNSPNDIKKRLQDLAGWELEEGKIVKSFGFKSFLEGIEFVKETAGIAEAHNHHPVITIVWKTVKISSISFDVGHLTERDFKLAKTIDELYEQKFEEQMPLVDNLQEEHRLLAEEEKNEKARKRTRGPYRKSSKGGLP